MVLFIRYAGGVKAVIIKQLVFLVLLAGMVCAGCTNTTMYYYSGVGTIGYTLVDLTSINYVDADLTRVTLPTGQTSYKYADYKLLIYTPGGSESFTVFINDYNTNDAKAGSSIIPDEVKTLSQSDFTTTGSYNLTFRKENASKTVIGFDDYVKLDLKILCDDYSPSIINLFDYNQTNIVFGTHQPSQFILDFEIIENHTYSRVHDFTLDNTVTNFYLPHTDIAEILTINYQLKDYDGDYGNSKLYLKNSLSGDTLETMDARQWDNNGYAYNVYLYKDQYYRIIVDTGTTTIDKGLFQYTTNGTQEIRVTEPVINFGEDTNDGVSLIIWNNVSTERLYCFWASKTDKYVSATITVYNVSGLTYTEIYTGSDTTNPTGTFSYLVDDVNTTYKTECVLTTTDREVKRIGVFVFWDSTIKFMNPPFTHEILGFSVTEIFAGFSLFFLMFVLGLSSQINGSYFAVFTAGVLWLFNYWGWFIVDSIILGFIMVLAVLYRIKQSRVGAG